MNPPSTSYTSSRERSAMSTSQSGSMRPSQDVQAYLRQYAREKPEAFALWCLGIGFVLGWKLKPW